MTLAHAPAYTLGAQAGLRRWEPVLAALCLAQFSEPFFAAWAQAQGATEPPGFARIFFAPAMGLLAWAAWRGRAEAWAAMRAAPLLLALVALAFASTLWSIESGATLRRSVWLALTMGFGLYLAWRYEWRTLIEIVAGAVGALVIGSLLVGVLAPGIGRMAMEHPGAWGGLWTHKNTLGGIMALGAPACIAAAFVAPQRRRVWLACAFGALALIFLSTSKTALVAMLLGLGVIGACMLARRGPLQAVLVIAGALAAVLLGAAIVLLAPDLIVGALGRDLTLTGRTEIWEAAAPHVAARPWLGFGYGAFWELDAGPAFWVRQAVNWEVASAHSGWLELSLGLGRVGVGVFALSLASTLARGLGSAFDARAGLWAPAFIAAFALYTLSESHVMEANNLFWTIYVAVAARLALDAREKNA
ncbi:MAG: O-antigen ligase family protein [Hyphomonadaceae bacterium]|nr:O-antigen ligase family protein [Hyphomonadaceae bacterium]